MANVKPRALSLVKTIHTRVATIGELEVIAALFDAYRQFYEQASDLASATRFIRERMQRNESVILLASCENKKTVGFCQLYPTFCSIEANPSYLLSDLFVVPEARRSSIGKALLLAAEKYSAEHGMVKMELTTARTNKPAQAAYESLGWIRDEVFYAYSKCVEL